MLSGILIIIFVGLLLWLGNLGLLNITRDWPLILVVVGLFSLVNLLRKNKKKRIIRALEKGKITVEEAEEKLKQT